MLRDWDAFGGLQWKQQGNGASYRGQPTSYLYSSGRDFSWRGDNKNFQLVLCVRHD